MPLRSNTCVVCEDVRLERRGLNSLMGVYGVMPDVNVIVKDLAQPVNVLLVFYGPPFVGTTQVKAELFDANATKLDAKFQPPTFQYQIVENADNSIIAFRVNCTYPSQGTYTVVLTDSNNQEVFRGKFRVTSGLHADFLA